MRLSIANISGQYIQKDVNKNISIIFQHYKKIKQYKILLYIGNLNRQPLNLMKPGLICFRHGNVKYYANSLTKRNEEEWAMVYNKLS